jgi:hypothetical protein
MTAIAGLIHDGKVYIGGDSAGIAGWDLSIRADPKVFTVGPYVMGFTTSFRMGQLLRFAFDPPEHHEDVAVERFMVTTFIDAVRACLSAGGYATKASEREAGGTFLVGYRGRLWSISDDYQVGEPLYGIAAVGCGDNQALGSLHTSQEWPDPVRRLRTALDAAERYSAGVRGPFTIEREP